MVKSILDTDLYKFSTSNAYFQLYPLAEGTFKFMDRNKEKCIKISDDLGKHMGDDLEFKIAYHELHLN